MNNAREDIFNRIKNKTMNNQSTKSSVVEQRIAAHQRGPVPEFSESVTERFIAKVKNVAGTVKEINSIDELPSAVSEYLLSMSLEMKFVTAATELQQANWPDEYDIDFRVAISSDLTSITTAYAAVAETGSLVLISDKETPTTLNFLPDNFICVLKQKDIHASMEDIWDLLRKENKAVPRSLNFITGPSRTADVEQTIQLGAHGPRYLHIILVK
jgi:L-lactate dehydrogenase complex protein LldG